jgi:hypothetical protein
MLKPQQTVAAKKVLKVKISNLVAPAAGAGISAR